MKYIIVKVNGKIREIIDESGKANKYGKAKLFTMDDAEKFIKKNTYVGMSCKYEILEKDR